jgi:hypothetical protein
MTFSGNMSLNCINLYLDPDYKGAVDDFYTTKITNIELKINGNYPFLENVINMNNGKFHGNIKFIDDVNKTFYDMIYDNGVINGPCIIYRFINNIKKYELRLLYRNGVLKGRGITTYN